jgi:hypothetical protein
VTLIIFGSPSYFLYYYFRDLFQKQKKIWTVPPGKQNKTKQNKKAYLVEVLLITDGVHEPVFSQQNTMTAIIWSNKPSK